MTRRDRTRAPGEADPQGSGRHRDQGGARRAAKTRPRQDRRHGQDRGQVGGEARGGPGAAVPAVADGLPHREAPAPKSERPPLELARRIVELAEDKKAADIVLLDLTALTTLADYFVICSGGSERQLDAIADGIVSPLRDEKTKPIGREGTPASHWVLVDFGSVVVHIFTPPERDYYGLEKHWSEARPSSASSSDRGRRRPTRRTRYRRVMPCRAGRT